MKNNAKKTLLKSSDLITPAFVIDTDALSKNARHAGKLVCDEQTRLLFALKSFSVSAGLREIARYVDGFAASSLNEALLARRVASKGQQTIHVTTPGLRPDEIRPLCKIADYISFNSISQWQRYRNTAHGRVNCGLRVNPQLSFVEDSRYDPCRKYSKLGVPLYELRLLAERNSEILNGINGIHFHSNCDSSDLQPLLDTVEQLLREIGPMFERIEWINLGGGYLFTESFNIHALQKAKDRLAEWGAYQLFTEPGAAIARSGGYIVSTVVDIFASGERQVAILDTSVNHMPEVFEYQFRPEVEGTVVNGGQAYILAGAACLAGDIFGEYRFDEPLTVGTRLVFPNRGAYSLVKANMFNGINLPSMYTLNETEGLREIRHFRFEDFLALQGDG